MGSVVFDISMSLDGFITAAEQTAEEPMGRDGERLHDWAFGSDERGQQVLAEGGAGAGAVICGRRTYDHSVPWWGADGPTGPARLPVFVVTHRAPDETLDGGVYRFVTDGLEAALDQARAAADDRDVAIMGGASIGQQYIRAGLVDELSIHLVPILFGEGTRMFETVVDDHVRLEQVGVTVSAAATHLRYRIVR